MTIAAGTNKLLVAKKQSGIGVVATASGAQVYRRVTSNIDVTPSLINSAEIRQSMQRIGHRHGTESVAGTINGELSVGTYAPLMASILRAAWAATSAYAAGIDVTAAATAPHFVDASGGFLTAGLKVGTVGRWTGFAGATANNDRNFLITALTATNMTGLFLDGTVVVADAAGDSVTFTPVGKSVLIPTTGHTRDYWTVEHVYPDIVQAEQYTDCVFGSMNVKMPLNANATVDFPIMGLGHAETTAAYFTTPTAESSGVNLASIAGSVIVNGAEVALIASMDISVNGNMSLAPGVMGTKLHPDITPGVIQVTGSMTVIFQDAVMRDYFLNSTEVSIVAALTTSELPTADFMTFTMPRVLIDGSTKDDGEKGLVMTMPFTAQQYTLGGASSGFDNTTLTICDSVAV